MIIKDPYHPIHITN